MRKTPNKKKPLTVASRLGWFRFADHGLPPAYTMTGKEVWRVPLLVGWVGVTSIAVQHHDSFIGSGEWGRARWALHLGENQDVRWYFTSHRDTMSFASQLLSAFSRYNKFPSTKRRAKGSVSETATLPLPTEPVFP